MHKILFYNKFTKCLYMFRALLCSTSVGQNCIIQHLVSSHLYVAVRCTGWEKILLLRLYWDARSEKHEKKKNCLNITHKKPYKRYEGKTNEVLIAFIGYVNDLNKLLQFKVSVQKSHRRLQCTFQPSWQQYV